MQPYFYETGINELPNYYEWSSCECVSNYGINENEAALEKGYLIFIK
jgi:hypothetical protein